MLIWIDLGNSPHVPFFLALSKEFEGRGHQVVWTARDYAQTVPLAHKAGIQPTVFGTHGGKNVLRKGIKFGGRIISLLKWARGKKIDLLVSHNSHEPLIVARMLRIKSVNLMDYEHHPINHLSFRMATWVVVPKVFPDEYLQKFGAGQKASRFDGIKEDVYLANFKPDTETPSELKRLGVEPENILIVVRPPALEALYHRQYENEIFGKMLDLFTKNENVRIILLPRKDYDAPNLRQKHPQKNIIIPDTVLDGASLIALADLVVSGGGTMNREAAALGTPVVTIFAGKSAAIDEMLVSEGRMLKIESQADLEAIKPVKKTKANRRQMTDVRRQVADLILQD